jgi:hypothetical protein
VSIGAIIGISIGFVAVAAVGVFVYMRRQQNILKNDIDSLLKQYLPLDAANSLAHPTDRQHDGYLPTSAPAPSHSIVSILILYHTIIYHSILYHAPPFLSIKCIHWFRVGDYWCLSVAD